MKRLYTSGLFLVLLMLGLVPHQGDAPTRWALIVGVGDYANFGNEAGGDLPGATNDARNIHQVLTERWGFEDANVRLLLDLEATRSAIETSLTDWLPSVVQPGDLVLFYYAGHGSQTWDQNSDEEDGLDETLCPTDVLNGSSSKDIRDDELAGWINSLPTENVTVILDSCHSGTATRSLAPFARTRALERDPASDLAAERAAATAGTQTRGAAIAVGDPDSFGEGVLEIASAQSHQYATEAAFEGINGGLPLMGGAFTTPFVQQLWQVPLNTSYEEVFELTLQVMKQRNFEQKPQITNERRAQRPVFAVAAPAAPVVSTASNGVSDNSAPVPVVLPSGAVPVLATNGSTIELGGGSAAGVTVGSLYHTGKNLVRVDRVTPNAAFASVVPGGARGMGADANDLERIAVGVAHLIAYDYPDPTLSVTVADLPTSVRSELSAELSGTAGLVLQPDTAQIADLIIRSEGSDFVVIGLDGSLRHSVEQSGSTASELARILEKELSAQRVAVLDNPARPFPVELSFGGPENQFDIGDNVEFRLSAARDGYLTIVDVDPAGAVNIVFPNQLDGNNRVQAGQPIVIPTPAMGFQFQAAEPAGRGIVRVFVTDRPLDIPSNGGTIEAEHLIGALREAAGAAPVAGSDAIMVDSWATASVVYDITR